MKRFIFLSATEAHQPGITGTMEYLIIGIRCNTAGSGGGKKMRSKEGCSLDLGTEYG